MAAMLRQQLKDCWWAVVVLALVDLAWYPVGLLAPGSKAWTFAVLLLAVPVVHFALGAVIAFRKGVNWLLVAVTLPMAYLAMVAGSGYWAPQLLIYPVYYGFFTGIGSFAGFGLKVMKARQQSAQKPGARQARAYGYRPSSASSRQWR